MTRFKPGSTRCTWTSSTGKIFLRLARHIDVARAVHRDAADKDQYNFTDPESRIMMGPDGILQGFNAQAAVEPTMQLIVGQRVTQAANDKEQLQPEWPKH